MHSVVFTLEWHGHLSFPFAFLPVDFLRNLFSSSLGLGSADKVLDELTLEGVAEYIKSGKCESLPALTILDLVC